MRVPDGFRLMPTRGPFIDANGPFYYDGEKGFGFFPEDHHCNLLGFAHGGIVATLLDSAMAHCVVNRHQVAIVTDELNITYKSVIVKNRWVSVNVKLQNQLNDHVQAMATLSSRGAVCAEGQAWFKLLSSRPLSNGGQQTSI